MVRLLVALLLLVTAALKAQVVWEGSSPAYAVFGSLRLQIVAIACSSALGVWLLSGKGARTAWPVAGAYFLMLAAVSFTIGLREHATCGCFGKLPISPWVAFGIDVAALGLLAAFPPWGGWAGVASSFGTADVPGGLPVALLATAVVGFGAVTPALWYLRGEPVVVEDGNLTFKGTPGEERDVPVSVYNRGRKPVTIYGATRECGMEATRDLPLTIAPGGRGTLRVLVYFSGPSAKAHRQGVLFTDAEGQPQVRFWLTLILRDEARPVPGVPAAVAGGKGGGGTTP